MVFQITMFSLFLSCDECDFTIIVERFMYEYMLIEAVLKEDWNDWVVYAGGDGGVTETVRLQSSALFTQLPEPGVRVPGKK